MHCLSQIYVQNFRDGGYDSVSFIVGMTDKVSTGCHIYTVAPHQFIVLHSGCSQVELLKWNIICVWMMAAFSIKWASCLSIFASSGHVPFK